MAVSVSNTNPANGTEAVHTLITVTLAAGYRVTRWSDGSSYTGSVSLSTNPYGSASSGAGNLGNASAWFCLAAPDGSREFLFQRSSATSWLVSRSRLGFTGGSPDATTVSTDATSGQNIWNGAGSAATFFDASPGSWNISCESTAPYGFTAFAIAGTNVRTLLFDEPLQSGTYDATDADPVLACAYYNATGWAGPTPGALLHTTSTAILYKRFRHGLSTPSNVRVEYCPIWSNAATVSIAPPSSATNQVGPDPYTTKERPPRIKVTRFGVTGTGTGECGSTNRHRWNTVHGRVNGNTLYDATAGSYWAFVGGIWVPWDSSTITLY